MQVAKGWKEVKFDPKDFVSDLLMDEIISDNEARKIKSVLLNGDSLVTLADILTGKSSQDRVIEKVKEILAKEKQTAALAVLNDIAGKSPNRSSGACIL